MHAPPAFSTCPRPSALRHPGATHSRRAPSRDPSSRTPCAPRRSIVSTPVLRINRVVPRLLPAILPGAAPGANPLPTAALVLLGLGGPLIVCGAIASFARRRRRRLAIVQRGHALGLSTASADLLARLVAGD